MIPFLEETQEFEHLVNAAQGDILRVPYSIARAVCTMQELGRYLGDCWTAPRDAPSLPVHLPLPAARLICDRAKTNVANRVYRSLNE